MKKIPLLIIGLSSFLFQIGGVGAACLIDKGPPPELVAYEKSVRDQIAAIRREAGSQSQCRGTQGTFSSERRFLSTLDRIDTQTFMWPDIVTDFTYSVSLASEGENRGPVTKQGKLWKTIESQVIISGLQAVTTNCTLDLSLASGGTPEGRIGNILRTHRLLEKYYWQVATGDTTRPEGLDSYQTLLDSIRDNYSPEATKECQSDYDVEDIMSRITDALGKMSKKNETATQTWKDAIDLFQGKNSGTPAYEKLQKRLLQTELARQGLTRNAKQGMLQNFTCFQARTDTTSTPEESAKTSFECRRNMLIGMDTVTQGLKPLINLSKTTDEYLQRTLAYSREQSRVNDDMGSFWQMLEKTKVTDESMNMKMITDLVNIHADIVQTNQSLKKRIEEMYDNCMKGQPSIPCPKP